MSTACYDCKHSYCESTFFIDSYTPYGFSEQHEVHCKLKDLFFLEEEQPVNCEDYKCASIEEGKENHENVDKYYEDKYKTYKLLKEAEKCWVREHEDIDYDDIDACAAARAYNFDGYMTDAFEEYYKNYVNKVDPDLWFRHTDKGYGE